jgi:hypothetical protein
MPPGREVRPEKWGEVLDLYDDGNYSAIWGSYDDDNNRCLGVRWNGATGEGGYPMEGGAPVWYIEPDLVTKEILLALLDKVITNKSLPGREAFQQNILEALSEFG